MGFPMPIWGVCKWHSTPVLGSAIELQAGKGERFGNDRNGQRRLEKQKNIGIGHPQVTFFGRLTDRFSAGNWATISLRQARYRNPAQHKAITPDVYLQTN
jgi:hypothetical protein